MSKAERQQKIVDLITAGNIPTQESLSELLEGAGFSVNQSSISRDLDELGIIKVNGFYSLPQIEQKGNAFGFSGLETAGDSLVVVRCEPGLAAAAAVAIDRGKVAEIVGTIAGDDTIFVAVKGKHEQKAVVRHIRRLLGG